MVELASKTVTSGNGVTPKAARATLLAEGGGAQDQLNWANLGLATGTLLDFAPGTRTPPFAVARTDGTRDVQITHPPDLRYFVSGSQNGWAGRFGRREGVIFTNVLPPENDDVPWKESIVIHLPFGVRGAGLQFDIRPRDGAAKPDFTAHMLSRHRNWDDHIKAEGKGSITPGDPAGSALFVGGFTENAPADFITLELWVVARGGRQIDFAINRVSLLI